MDDPEDRIRRRLIQMVESTLNGIIINHEDDEEESKLLLALTRTDHRH